MNADELRKRLGEKKYSDLIEHAKRLADKKMSPDDIARDLETKFQLRPGEAVMAIATQHRR
jgi:hypothetical protein